MADIYVMRESLNKIYQGMGIDEFIALIGYPDEINCLSNEIQCYVWDSPVWKGIFRGGTVHRKISLLVGNRKIISWSSENLNRSRW